MVTVEEASSIVLQNCFQPKVEKVKLTDAVGRVLATAVGADRDLPPYDRVAMDGIAIRFESWNVGQREFTLENVQAAGTPRMELTDPANAMEVMTGAVVPLNCDTVIPYEQVEINGNAACITVTDVIKGQNIHRQGKDAKSGQMLVTPGTVVSPAEVAVLASIGAHTVEVFSMPKAAIIASGDELIDVHESPEPHQIRRSNSYALQAAMKELQWPATQFHLPDRKDFLRESLALILADHDVLILSGGVSKGKYDYIPDVLAGIKVRRLFHHVSQRPGKPFWFGVTSTGKTVFALPGNPVSTFLCFLRYVKPWLKKSLSVPTHEAAAVLGTDFTSSLELTYFVQVRLSAKGGVTLAMPNPGGGSGDFANLREVDGFVELPAGKTLFAAGEVCPLLTFR